MKKIIITSLISLFMVSCNNSNKKSQNSSNAENQEETPIGGEKDAHGCITAAGESWSELRQSCIQIFKEGIRLDPVENIENEAVISAFILFNEDKSKAEIFLPNDEKNVILEKKLENMYQNEQMKFDFSQGILYLNDKQWFKK